MKKITASKKLLSGLLVGAVVLTAGSLVLANSSVINSSTDGKASTFRGEMMKGRGGNFGVRGQSAKGMFQQKEGIKSILDEMVSEGTLSQEEADKLIEYMNQQQEERAAAMKEMENKTPEERKALMEEKMKEMKDQGKKGGFLSGAVEKGILTQEKADAIEKKMSEKQKSLIKDFKGKRPAAQKEDISSVLNEMVSEGTLQQSKVDEFSALVKQQEEERTAALEEMKNKTPEERKALMQEKMKEKEPGNKKVGILDSAVEKGIFTQEEVTAIQNKMHQKQEAERQEKLKAAFSSLVEKSVLTQEQADKIVETIQKNNDNMKAAMEKMKEMSQEERRTYLESIKQEKNDVFKELIEDGTLTQEQVDAIKAALPFRQQGFMQRVDKGGFKHGEKGRLKSGVTDETNQSAESTTY